MDQLGNELKKILMAGIGAATTAVEKTGEVIEKLAQKGEITYEQAKEMGAEAAAKIKKAVDESGIADAFTCKPRVENVKNDLKQMSQEELDEIKGAIDAIYAGQPSKAEDACCCCEDDCCKDEAAEECCCEDDGCCCKGEDESNG